MNWKIARRIQIEVESHERMAASANQGCAQAMDAPEGMVQVYEQTTFKVRRSNSPYTKVSGCRGVAVIEQEQLDEVNPCNDGTFRLCEHEILTD